MKKNVGTIDAVVRYIIAVVLAALIYMKVLTGTIAIIAGIVAAAMLLTGLFGWCGLYALLGINTCRKK
ncbi:MAG: DUF2892 domain-containing protein [Bacteroidales bacterium]